MKFIFAALFLMTTVSCNTLADFEKSKKVAADWEAKKAKIKADGEARRVKEENEIAICEQKISDCKSKVEKDDLLNCRENLKGCSYTFEVLNSERGKSGIAGIRAVDEQCFTYGYERHDLKKMPANAVIPWSPSVRGHGEFKTIDECIAEKDKDPLGQPRGNWCVQHDWCKNENSLVGK